MTKIQTTCPQCHQPVVADIQQTFDLQEDPLAKQKMLSGISNIIHCPICGYNGMIATPIVYHDPEKELLLTYFPPELNIPLNEQEKQLGVLINKIIDRLPKEKRKAYILQPQSMLTYQTLLEKILEADGITKEMLEKNQKRIRLLQQLLKTQKANLPKVIKEEEALIDYPFFSILSRLIQSTVSQGDKESNEKLIELQNILFEKTKTGKEIHKVTKDTEKAMHDLQEASKGGLTREKLLELVIKAPSDTQLSTIVSLTRPGIDYIFFQKLSDRIDAAMDTNAKQELTKLREKLLHLTEEIDKRAQKELNENKILLNNILKSDNIESSTKKNLPKVSELFLKIVEDELSTARKKSDLEKIQKIERVLAVIKKAIEPTKEIKLLEKFLTSKNEVELQKSLEENKEMITPEFIQLLNSTIAQSGKQGKDNEESKKLREVYKSVLRFSMRTNLNK